MRPDCPECGLPLASPFKSCRCGWGKEAKAMLAQKHMCVWRNRGEPCQAVGICSDSTVGGGPWYCRDHYADLKGWERADAPRTADKEPIEEVDKRVSRVVPRLPGESDHDWSMRCKEYVLAFVRRQVARKPDTSWARKVMARQAAGEMMPIQSLQYAQEVLPMREPGEDQEEVAARTTVTTE